MRREPAFCAGEARGGWPLGHAEPLGAGGAERSHGSALVPSFGRDLSLRLPVSIRQRLGAEVRRGLFDFDAHYVRGLTLKRLRRPHGQPLPRPPRARRSSDQGAGGRASEPAGRVPAEAQRQCAAEHAEARAEMRAGARRSRDAGGRASAEARRQDASRLALWPGPSAFGAKRLAGGPLLKLGAKALVRHALPARHEPAAARMGGGRRASAAARADRAPARGAQARRARP